MAILIRPEADQPGMLHLNCLTMASPMRGIPLPVVSRLLGHSQLSMTMRYAHISNKLVEASAEKIGTILAEYLDAG